MNLLELVTRTRSYRRFDQSVSISLDTLMGLINLARLASSARNAQALKYMLINNDEDCAKIFPLLSWAGYLKDWNGPAQGERPTAYILVFKDSSINTNIHCDDGLAMQNILLGANEQGLGGCIIGAFSREKIRELFAINAELEVLHIIALGKPAETVVLEEMQQNDTKYWRDDASVHHVPKRNLNDIIIKK